MYSKTAKLINYHRSLFLTRMIAVAVVLLSHLNGELSADVFTFGSGANQFSIEFVHIGSPGNAADTTGRPNPAGAVSYEYYMGKYEISRDMILKYNTAYGTTNSLAISMHDMTHEGGNSPNQPAAGISWNEAARFVNWLNTSSGYKEAYKFTTGGVNDNIQLWSITDDGYDPLNPFRNKHAMFALPSTDEWYKSAFFDPVTSLYFDYPTGSDSPPTPVASGTNPGTAVYNQGNSQGPADIYSAGGLSPLGVMAQGGNVGEWEETSKDGLNSGGGARRGLRGGIWSSSSGFLSSGVRFDDVPTIDQSQNTSVGFRVVSLGAPGAAAVPEPGSFALMLAGLSGFGVRHLKRRKVQVKS
jgi:formylglycine-generating enzyme required for sulfatase activity